MQGPVGPAVGLAPFLPLIVGMETTVDDVPRRERRLVDKPQWLKELEHAIGRRVPVHPNVLSAVKLVIVAPLLLLSLRQVEALVGGRALVCALFAAFGVLDYLDGVVARERGLATAFGRVFDRLTDYPLLIGLSYWCLDVLPLPLLAIKLALDVLLLVLYALGKGSTENRIRTAISYATLFGLLALSQGWLPDLATRTLVKHLLGLNIVLSAVVALYNLDLLDKRYVASVLSFGNLACGLMAIHASWRGNFVGTLVLLLVGVVFDGFDGVAARRWGSVSWGVYADDVADAVNFGIAPGAAVAFGLGGWEGALAGTLFAIFTIGRLVYFTLNKTHADPGYFAGVPSPVGGLIALCAVILFRDHPALVGLLVGIACAQMVSFSASYRHLGRLLASQRALLSRTPLGLLPLVAVYLVWGTPGPVALILGAGLAYAVYPSVRAFAKLVEERGPASTPLS